MERDGGDGGGESANNPAVVGGGLSHEGFGETGDDLAAITGGPDIPLLAVDGVEAGVLLGGGGGVLVGGADGDHRDLVVDHLDGAELRLAPVALKAGDLGVGVGVLAAALGVLALLDVLDLVVLVAEGAVLAVPVLVVVVAVGVLDLPDEVVSANLVHVDLAGLLHGPVTLLGLESVDVVVLALDAVDGTLDAALGAPARSFLPFSASAFLTIS